MRGLNFELRTSEVFHAKGTPILASPLMLRAFGGGQIDMARIRDGMIEVVECKDGDHFPTNIQIRRIKDSAKYLAEILQKSARISLVQENHTYNL